jgi:nucleotide-binding universal stress UspA family protein
LRAPGPWRTLVVATDLSPASRSVFPAARALAQAFHSRVAVVHAQAGGRIAREEDIRDFVGDDLGNFVVRLADGAAWRAIVTMAAEEGADAVALGRHGLDGSGEGLLGTTTDRVLRQAPCPVLVG